MKSLIILPLAMLLSAGASASTIDGKNSKTQKIRNKLEIRELFNGAQNISHVSIPSQPGKAIALVRIDSNGQAKVLESNASSDEMRDYVEAKVQSKNLKSFKNETIKVVIEYRK